MAAKARDDVAEVLEFADIKLLHYGRAVKESELPRSGT
jgi:hypothetical protein